jgi:hypothetical protein
MKRANGRFDLSISHYLLDWGRSTGVQRKREGGRVDCLGGNVGQTQAFRFHVTYVRVNAVAAGIRTCGREILEGRYGEVRVVNGLSEIRLVEADQVVLVGVRKGTKQHAIDDAEHRRIDADTKRQCEKSGRCETGIAHERPRECRSCQRSL